MHGHDHNVRPTADDGLGVAPQISVIPGLLALSLHCIRHVLLLRQKCVAEKMDRCCKQAVSRLRPLSRYYETFSVEYCCCGVASGDSLIELAPSVKLG